MAEAGYLPRQRFQVLIDALVDAGYRCIGPQAVDGAIVFRPLHDTEQLPCGVGDSQEPGRYRLAGGRGERLFGWSNGPQAIKPLAFAPRETVWRVERDPDGQLRFTEGEVPETPVAVIGVRACDLAALDIQDRHFLAGPFPNPQYGKRRERQLLVAVNCSHPAATCFCASTGDGPGASYGFDLLLDELDDGFVVTSGSPRGEAIASALQLAAASEQQIGAAGAQVEAAAAAQTRALPSRNLRAPLFNNLEHPRWDDVAGRCFACGNCTSVCPTCFCHKETEQPELGGGASAHVREWDSCFTAGHSYIHGFVVREDIRKRYRQWLTHKLGSWHDQFGRSGCVGCGRCIAWCPAAIDITEEATAICGGKSDE